MINPSFMLYNGMSSKTKITLPLLCVCVYANLFRDQSFSQRGGLSRMALDSVLNQHSVLNVVYTPTQ